MIGLRPEHDIDVWRAAQDLGAFRLRDAAGDGDDHASAASRLGSFSGRSRPSSENTFSAAFSRIWQVLKMTMSAPSGVSIGA